MCRKLKQTWNLTVLVRENQLSTRKTIPTRLTFDVRGTKSYFPHWFGIAYFRHALHAQKMEHFAHVLEKINLCIIGQEYEYKSTFHDLHKRQVRYFEVILSSLPRTLYSTSICKNLSQRSVNIIFYRTSSCLSQHFFLKFK